MNNNLIMNKYGKALKISLILCLTLSILISPLGAFANSEIKAVRRVLVVPKGQVAQGVKNSKTMGISEVADGIPPALKDKVTEDILPYVYEEKIYKDEPENNSLKEVKNASGADIAEYYPTSDQGLEAGDVVAISSQSAVPDADMKYPIEKSGKAYDQKMLGVISTSPAIVINNGESQLERTLEPVALTGRVPVKVSLESGSIAVGDYLTSSNIPGVAMKATKPGRVIGMALENFDQSNITDQALGIGKVMMFVNPSWRDPDVYLTSTGDLFISPTATGSGYSLKDSLGQAVSRVGAFSEIAAASLKAGFLSVQEIEVSSLIIGGQTLGDYIASSSARTNYSPSDNPLFGELQNKVANLESQINLLSQKADQQASISAFLMEIQNGQVLGASTSAALDLNLGNVDMQNATVSGNLMVLGRATVTDLGVTGNINAGFLTIDGFNGEINTLGKDLYLQKNGLAGVNILDGKVVIDTAGNMSVAGEITVRKINIDESTTDKKSIGEAIIVAGNTETEVKTSALTSRSRIFVSSDKPVQIGATIKDGQTIKIRISNPSSEDVKVNWWVVN
jgi:hypothetical protein